MEIHFGFILAKPIKVVFGYRLFEFFIYLPILIVEFMHFVKCFACALNKAPKNFFFSSLTTHIAPLLIPVPQTFVEDIFVKAQNHMNKKFLIFLDKRHIFHLESHEKIENIFPILPSKRIFF